MALKNSYDLGDLVRCRGVFTDGDGDNYDPTGDVVFKWLTPGRIVSTLTYGVDGAVVRSSTGDYYVDLDIDEVGTWYYRFEADGAGQAAGENRFYVKKSQFGA